MVGEFFHHSVQHLGKGQINQFILFPNVLACAVVVWIQYLLFAPGLFEAAHIVNKVWENNLRILQILQPFRFPLQGDKAVIVHRRQSQHHIADRHSTLTDELICALFVRVAQVDVGNVSTQILDGGIATLTEIPVGVMHIPQRCQIVAGKPVQKLAEAGGIGINAAGFDQNGYIFGAGICQKGGQIFLDSTVALARQWGMSEAVISITLIAGGTSLPELAASLAAAVKKSTSLALGNIIGSNIFNITLILGLSSLVTPLNSAGITPMDYAVMTMAAILPLLLGFRGKIGRLGGAFMFILFIAYTAYLLNIQTT